MPRPKSASHCRFMITRPVSGLAPDTSHLARARRFFGAPPATAAKRPARPASLLPRAREIVRDDGRRSAAPVRRPLLHHQGRGNFGQRGAQLFNLAARSGKSGASKRKLAGCFPDTALRCVPLTSQGEVIGVLYVESPRGAEQFDEGNRQKLLLLSDTLGLALGNLRLRERLRTESVRDPLTGVFNRRFLHEVLAFELARSAQSGQPFSLMMLDIDHFKDFNDITETRPATSCSWSWPRPCAGTRARTTSCAAGAVKNSPGLSDDGCRSGLRARRDAQRGDQGDRRDVRGPAAKA